MADASKPKAERSPNERMCFSKKRYSTESYANQVARDTSRRRNVVLRVYKCPYCLNWHLTSQTEGGK